MRFILNSDAAGPPSGCRTSVVDPPGLPSLSDGACVARAGLRVVSTSGIGVLGSSCAAAPSPAATEPRLLRGGLDLDLSVPLPDLPARLIQRRRSIQHPAIVKGELRPVPRPHHRTVLQISNGKATAEM